MLNNIIYLLLYYKIIYFKLVKDFFPNWGLGIGDWGFGVLGFGVLG